MLEIKACTDKRQVTAYCRKCGRVPGEDFYLYLASDGGEALASALFQVLSAEVRVLYYEAADPQDASLMDGVLRAGLNYASRFGIPKGCIPEALRYEHRALFAQLNYPTAQVFDILNFFQKYKNCVNHLP